MVRPALQSFVGEGFRKPQLDGDCSDRTGQPLVPRSRYLVMQ